MPVTIAGRAIEIHGRDELLAAGLVLDDFTDIRDIDDRAANVN